MEAENPDHQFQRHLGPGLLAAAAERADEVAQPAPRNDLVLLFKEFFLAELLFGVSEGNENELAHGDPDRGVPSVCNTLKARVSIGLEFSEGL